jgi:alpha-aminoadipic semialdehyde synthase
MNEIGLDPGIDHLTACETFDQVKSKGGIITSFVSWCGGLPAPEVSDNPLGYKFSWSPRGVLLAGLNSAKFKRDGKLVDIPGNQLLNNAIDVPIFKGYSFEGLANRDSLSYIKTYQLDDQHLQTMFRGTLRYKGYSKLMHLFGRMGLLNLDLRTDLKTGISWGEAVEKLIGKNLESGMASKGISLGPEEFRSFQSAMKWLELDSKDNQVSPTDSIFDAFCDLLQKKLAFGEGERDMVAMHHEFGIKWGNGTTEQRTSTMITYGDPNGYSAMAKTVGYPAAIATDMILKGLIKDRGVIAPMKKEIYEPMIKKLHQEGISFVEKTL